MKIGRQNTAIRSCLGLAFAFAVVMEIGIAAKATAQIIKIDATGTIASLSGRAINPNVELYSKIHFSVQLLEGTPSIEHEYYNGGYEDRYSLLNVSYDFGDVHVSQTTTQTDLMICAGFAGQWSYAFEGFTDNFGSGGALAFFFPEHAFDDSALPPFEVLQDRLENGSGIIGFVQFGGDPYYYSGLTYWGLDSLRVSYAVPESSTYGLTGAAVLLCGAGFKRRRRPKMLAIRS